MSRPRVLDQHGHIYLHLLAERLARHTVQGKQSRQLRTFADHLLSKEMVTPPPQAMPLMDTPYLLSTSSWVLKSTWCPKPGRERRLILGRVLFTILSLDG